MLNTLPVAITSAAYDAFIERDLARVAQDLDNAEARAELVDSIASSIEQRKTQVPDPVEFVDALGAITDAEAVEVLAAFRAGPATFHSVIGAKYRESVAALARAAAEADVQRLDDDARRDAAARGDA
ncbi:hypothetical protein WI38_32745 [Burkholderia ubonensis]|uniref:Uncharacterized protein n=1 Tax=Burkholderia ubonensis TaxID=101571 RepID=A0A102K8N2_9BURK|nr:hypothetical protein [Burkholderia ubonensis]KUZ70699.1 hypothetical protein WI35_15590 [Burkholderia ubonensis]KUZ80949.1 hypothetical protein WI38_32745 [Burkholderia ubonensis]KVA02725.1 hypothetical protein WI39_33045 [Burkholderia ubonensis]